MKLLRTLTFLLLALNAFCMNTNFQSFSFDAETSDSQTINAEVSSCLDSQNNTHITWIKDTGDDRYLMYTVFDNASKTFSHSQITTPSSIEKKIAPNMILDDNDKPHIVYMIKRDPSQGTASGNYAVMYATSQDGSNFTVTQVSTNPTDPDQNTNGIYHCYVNDRPQISWKNGNILISYLADNSSASNWNKYIIFARKNGSNWERSQEIKTDSYDTYDMTVNAVALPQKMSSNQHMGWIDISNHAPHFFSHTSGWQNNTISGYGGTFSNKHPQVEVDHSGNVHYFWYNHENDKFCHTTLNGSNYSPVDETVVQENQSGNLTPATCDLTTGEKVYFYEKSYSSLAYMITFNGSNAVETAIDGIGTVFGRRALNVNNGYISLVTAENGDKIWVTVNGNSGIEESNLTQNINLLQNYPNPFNPNTSIKVNLTANESVSLAVFNANGEQVKALYSGNLTKGSHSFDFQADKLGAGIYYARIKTKNGVASHKMVLLK